MSTDDMNEAIRTAAARGRFTVDESPTDEGTVEMNRAIRREPDAEVEPAETETGPPAVPDLGQGARGPGPLPAPSMSDVIRGAAHAKRQLVADEIETERQLRTRGPLND